MQPHQLYRKITGLPHLLDQGQMHGEPGISESQKRRRQTGLVPGLQRDTDLYRLDDQTVGNRLERKPEGLVSGRYEQRQNRQ